MKILCVELVLRIQDAFLAACMITHELWSIKTAACICGRSSVHPLSHLSSNFDYT